MGFVPYGTTVPGLLPYQFSFDSYLFGFDTAFELTKLEGIDLPVVRSGDSGRPRDQGLFKGLDVMGGREITVTGQLRKDEVSFGHAWAALAGATVPGGTEEAPLYLCLPGYGTLATLARVRKRQMPIDIQFSLGNLADVTLLFVASDPRWYTATQQSSVKPPSTTAGFKFNVTFPLSFGGGGLVGSLSVNNEGDIETRPILIVEGPCTNPSITLSSAEGAPNLTFDLVLAAGDRLVIETDLHTATYYSSGSSIGSTRLYTLAPGSQWFTLPPGVSTLQYLAGTGEGTLTVQYASAFII